MSFQTAIPYLPSDDLETTERFYAALGFSLIMRDDLELRLASGDVQLRFTYLPGHARVVGTEFSGKTVALRTASPRAMRRKFKKAGIEWRGWTPPHLGAMEIRGEGRCFAFSDADGNLFWVEEIGSDRNPAKD